MAQAIIRPVAGTYLLQYYGYIGGGPNVAGDQNLSTAVVLNQPGGIMVVDLDDYTIPAGARVLSVQPMANIIGHGALFNSTVQVAAVKRLSSKLKLAAAAATFLAKLPTRSRTALSGLKLKSTASSFRARTSLAYPTGTRRGRLSMFATLPPSPLLAPLVRILALLAAQRRRGHVVTLTAKASLQRR